MYSNSLIDLSQLLTTNINKTSIILIIECTFYTIGSLTTGFIINLIHKQLLTIILLITMGLSIALSPFTSWFWAMIILIIIKGKIYMERFLINLINLGLSCGGLYTVLIMLTLDLKDKSYIQGMLFVNSLGSFITSLMLSQVLASESVISNCFNLITFNQINHIQANHDQLTHNRSNYDQVNTTEYNCSIELSLIKTPYLIEGFLSLSAASMLSIAFIYEQSIDKENKEQKKKKKKNIKIKRKLKLIKNRIINKKIVFLKKLFYIIFGSILTSFYVGMEIANFELLPLFIRLSDQKADGTVLMSSGINGMSDEQEIALVMACLFGACSIGRALILLIPADKYTKYILALNFAIIAIANLIIMNTKPLNMSLILLGLGMSSVISLLIQFLQRHIKFTSKIIVGFVSAGGLMAIVNTSVISKSFD